MTKNIVEQKKTTLLFVSYENDFQKKVKPFGFYGVNLIIERVDVDYNAIIKRIDELADDAPFVLFLHLNATHIDTFAIKLKGLVRGIQKMYPNLRINYNTSQKTEEILTAIKKHMPWFQENHLYLNQNIDDYIEDKSIQIQTKKEITVSTTTDELVLEQGEVSIFLSHSSLDNNIMRDFKEMLLEAGLQVPQRNIFYSTERSSGVPTSKDITATLYKEIQQKTLFIRYVSESYNKSVVCHNEFGAAWYKNQNELTKIITLKERGLSNNEIGFLNGSRLYTNIEDGAALRQFRTDYKQYFPNTDDNRWEESLEKFIEKHFPKQIDKQASDAVEEQATTPRN